MTTVQKVTRSKGLHGPLEEHSDEFLCMDEWWFYHSLVETGQTGRTERFAFPNVLSKKFYIWISGLVLNISLLPYGTKHRHCYPSYCLQPGAVCCNGNVCKTPFTSPKKISTSPDIGIKSCRAKIQSV